MLSSSNPFDRRDTLFLVAALAVVALYVARAGGGFPLDDSWIHQVYARNLAHHGEWAYLPGQPSAGSTAPLYTLLLSIGYALNIPYALWTHLLGALALAAAGMIGARMVDQLLPDVRYIGLLTGLALIFAWHLIWAAASGMETMLFAAFSLALMRLAWREFHTSVDSRTLVRGIIFGAVSALIALTRPEGVMLAGMCGLTVVTLRGRDSFRDTLLWTSGAVAGFTTLIAPYLLLNLNLTGGLLPNTASAKQAQHAPLLANPYLTRLAGMTIPILAGGQVLLLPGMICFTTLRVRRAREEFESLVYLLPVFWAVGLIALYAARLPAAYQHGRYVIPALPGLIVIGVAGTYHLVRYGRRNVIGRVLTRTLAAAAVVTFVYFGLILGPTVYRQDVRIIEEEMVAAAKWIDDNLPQDELLAVHDIGALGYFAPRPILDIAGLVSPEIVPLINHPDQLWDRMRERGAVYLMAFPDQIPGHDPNDERLCPLYQSEGTTSQASGGSKMTVYALDWRRNGCDSRPSS